MEIYKEDDRLDLTLFKPPQEVELESMGQER